MSPATWANSASGDSLWCSTAPMPPPYGIRMTTGILTLPSDAECIFASWVTIWSYAGKTNPSNWISHHRPVAAQREADRGADDAGLGQRGVDDPVLAEVLLQAVGDPEDAAELADVLTHDQDLGVVLQRRAQAALIALAREKVIVAAMRHARLGTDAVGSKRRLVRGELRPLLVDGGVPVGVDVLEDRLSASGSGMAAASRTALASSSPSASSAAKNASSTPCPRGPGSPQPHDRVLGPHSSRSSAAPVAGRVVGGGVRAHPVGERLDQHRALAAAARSSAAAGDREAGQHVVAVDPDAGEAEARGALVERDPGLPLGGLGDRPLVVLAEEHDRGVVDGGEDEGLGDVALAGGPVTEVADQPRSRVAVADLGVELRPSRSRWRAGPGSR